MNLETLREQHRRAESLYQSIDQRQYDHKNHHNTMTESNIWREVIAGLFPECPEWHGAIYVLYAGWHYYGGEWPTAEGRGSTLKEASE